MSAEAGAVEADRRRFMSEAVRLAIESVPAGGGPFGAVVVRAGEIIARASNRVRIDSDPTAHAEILAIRAACEALGSFQLEGCEVYASAEPCPMCMGALYWARPGRVFYASSREAAAQAGFDDGFIYDELSRPEERRELEVARLPVEGAGEEFRAWADLPGRAEY